MSEASRSKFRAGNSPSTSLPNPRPVVLVERPLRGYVRDVSGPFRREDAFGAVVALLDVARVRAELGKLEDEA